MFTDPHLRAPVAISLGAIAGALSRYYLSTWLTHHLGHLFPFGTFVINLTGCMAMGFFSTLVLERYISIPPDIQLLIATGFLGSYTTFSTYSLESFFMLKNGLTSLKISSTVGSTIGSTNLLTVGAIALYWPGSMLLGVLSIQLGISLAHWFYSQ